MIKTAETPPRTEGRARRLRAKVFWTGRSQAIRLPKEMRVATAEVLIGREGTRLVIEPVAIERDAMGWPTVWWQLAGAAPELDLGERGTRHERGDVFAPRRRR